MAILGVDIYLIRIVHAEISGNNTFASIGSRKWAVIRNKGLHGNTFYLIEITADYPDMKDEISRLPLGRERKWSKAEGDGRALSITHRYIHLVSSVESYIFVVRPRKKKVVEICKRHDCKKVFTLRCVYVRKEAYNRLAAIFLLAHLHQGRKSKNCKIREIIWGHPQKVSRML